MNMKPILAQSQVPVSLFHRKRLQGNGEIAVVYLELQVDGFQLLPLVKPNLPVRMVKENILNFNQPILFLFQELIPVHKLLRLNLIPLPLNCLKMFIICTEKESKMHIWQDSWVISTKSSHKVILFKIPILGMNSTTIGIFS